MCDFGILGVKLLKDGRNHALSLAAAKTFNTLGEAVKYVEEWVKLPVEACDIVKFQISCLI